MPIHVSIPLNMKAGLSLSFLYPPPASVFVNVISAVTLVSLANAGFREIRGTQHLQYSKFCDNKDEKKKALIIPSRVGMFFLYFPAFLVAFVWLAFFTGDASERLVMLAGAVTLHFLKRVLEVIFLHKYSGGIGVESTAFISISYLLFSLTSIYSQYLQGASEPSMDLKYAGAALFFVGLLGNFYHHLLLSKLRAKDGEGYKIPKGGLFSVIICPHYLFEIIGFLGICFISPTVYTVSFTLGSTLYLTGRGYTTRNWYMAKFPNFPKQIRTFIPCIF